MNTIYLECNMGATGDMLMSALYEICPQKDSFLNEMNTAMSPLGVTLTADTSIKCGIRGTHIHVLVSGAENCCEQSADTAMHMQNEHAHEAQTSENYASILEKIASLPLADEVREDASAIYRLIMEAYAKVQETSIDQLHLPKVGTLDVLTSVVGCVLLIDLIAPEQILSSPIHVGNGFVSCTHGVLPVPAPATAELLTGIPYYTGSITSELCTPTGAAILKYYVTRFSPMPVMTTSAIGYGMGEKDFAIANCVRAFWGDTASYLTAEEDAEDEFAADDIVLSISCNIDDMTGEALSLATEILMTAGALDVYTIPVQMKKNRPGILLTCLCQPKDREKFTGLFFLHTSARDIRYQTFERAKLDSTFETHATSYGDIRLKKSSGYGIEKVKPEFEDLKSAVLKHNCSLDDVVSSLHRTKNS